MSETRVPQLEAARSFLLGADMEARLGRPRPQIPASLLLLPCLAGLGAAEEQMWKQLEIYAYPPGSLAECLRTVYVDYMLPLNGPRPQGAEISLEDLEYAITAKLKGFHPLCEEKETAAQ